QEHIRQAETVFMATGYRDKKEDDQDDPRFGNDASHRGGTAGFLIPSQDGTRIFLPDYAGNDMYMSLGNLVNDPKMGISVPLYETGGMIQMTGTATIHWEDTDEYDRSLLPEVPLSTFQGALRWLEFHIDEVNELPAGSLPIRWDAGDRDTKLQVQEKIQESDLLVATMTMLQCHGAIPLAASRNQAMRRKHPSTGFRCAVTPLELARPIFMITFK
ncbi:MAG: hypothetical protein SGILL_008981, partial [Bacillariaceae sp.]